MLAVDDKNSLPCCAPRNRRGGRNCMLRKRLPSRSRCQGDALAHGQPHRKRLCSIAANTASRVTKWRPRFAVCERRRRRSSSDAQRLGPARMDRQADNPLTARSWSPHLAHHFGRASRDAERFGTHGQTPTHPHFRLARERIYRARLEREADAQTHAHVRHLSTASCCRRKPAARVSRRSDTASTGGCIGSAKAK